MKRSRWFRFVSASIASLFLAGCSHGASSHEAPDGWHHPLSAPSVAGHAKEAVPAAVHSDAVLPSVSGAFADRAAISLPHAQPSGKFVVAPVTTGPGRAAQAGDVAVVNYTAKVWRTGKSLPGPYDKHGHPVVFAVGRGATLPAIDRAVAGHGAGSRVLVVAPPAAAYGKTGNTDWGVKGTDTVVFAVDILKVVPGSATVDGTQRTISDALPQVRMNARAGTAAITVPDRTPPKSLVTSRLIEGAGPEVKAGQTVVLQYSSTIWQTARGKDRARLFASSHADGHPLTVVIGRGNVLKGWDQSLVGQRAGSRLLLALPADLAYGAHPPKGVPAGATVVSVIDILAVI
jgi:FKBP-type peptidyl-prolyl cis-trans isomerase